MTSYAPMTNDNLVEKLGNVSINNLQNNEILKYNSTTDKWENAVDSGGGGGGGGATQLNDLTDVTTSTPVSGHLLIRDATNFKNRALEANDIPTLPQSKITNLTTDLSSKYDANTTNIPQSQITGLTTALSSKLNANKFNLTSQGNLQGGELLSYDPVNSTWNSIITKVSDLLTTTSSIPQSQITNLTTDLNSKYDASTTNIAQSQISGLSTALSSKYDSSTNIPQSQISGLSTDLAGKQATITSTTDVTCSGLTAQSVDITGRFNISDSIFTDSNNAPPGTEIEGSIVKLQVNNSSYMTFVVHLASARTINTITLINLNTYGTQLILRIQDNTGDIVLPANITINKTTTATSPTTTAFTTTHTDISSDVTITPNDACLVFIYVANANNVFLTHKLFT